MLIQEIASSDASSTDETAAPVALCLDALIAHYHQQVHVPCESDEPSNKGIPPVVKYQFECLQQQQCAPWTTIATDLLVAYTDRIRPVFFGGGQLQSLGVAVLVHYEWLVRLVCNENNLNKEEEQQQQAPTCRQVSDVMLNSVVEQLANDLTLATATTVSSKTEHEDFYIRRNHVIPCLLRLATCAVSVMSTKTLLRYCSGSIVRLLAFATTNAMRPSDIHPGIVDNVIGRLDPFLVYPMSNQSEIQVETNVASVQLDEPVWISDQTLHLNNEIWNVLYEKLVPLQSSSFTVLFSLQDQQRAVLKALDLESTAKSVRAHFFGRDMLSESAATEPMQLARLHLGKMQPYQLPSQVAELPYEKIPSRVHVALRFVGLLDSDSCCESILDELLPICYQLLAARQYAWNGHGAVALYHLLQCAEHGINSNNKQWLLNNAANLLQALNVTISQCREGPILALMGMTQRYILSIVAPLDAIYQQQRRVATLQWFKIAHGNVHRTDADNILLHVLASGIIPLLSDHVHCANADCVELGQFGLQVLLPLLQNSALYQQRIQSAALVALANLMVAAHPGMPRHGGKLMSTLLVVAAATKEREFALHVTAIGLVLTGERGRLIVEGVVMNAQGEYSAALIETAADVQMRAKNFQRSC